MTLKLGTLSVDIEADTSDLAAAEKEIKNVSKVVDEESNKQARSVERSSKRSMEASTKASKAEVKEKVKATQKSVAESKKSAAAAEKSHKRAATAAKKAADKEVKEAKRVADARTKGLKSIAAVFVGAQALGFAKDLILVADNAQVLERRIVRFTGSIGEARKTFRQLADTAGDTGTTIADTLSIFQRFSLVRDDLGATNEQVIQFTDTLSKLGAIGGSSSEEISNALRQLAQGLSGGILRAEEFNSLIENTPEIIRAMGAEMGLSMGQVRKELLAGRLTSDKVFNAILDSSKKTNEEFERLPKSIGMVTQALKNELAIAIKDVDEGLNFTSTISKSIGKFKEFIKLMNDQRARQREEKARQERINDLISKAKDGRGEEAKAATEVNKLLERNLFLEDRLTKAIARRSTFRGASVADTIRAEMRANVARIEQLTKESKLVKEITDIRAGIDPKSVGEDAIKPVKIDQEASKADQNRIDRIRQLGESERDEILRIEEERRAFILSQEQITADERQELLENIGKDRFRAMQEINRRLNKEEADFAERSLANRQREFDDAISAARQASDAISGMLSSTGNDQAARAASLISGVSQMVTTIATLSQASALAQAASDPSAVTTIQKVANIATMSAQFASIFTILKTAKGGGRQFGGTVSPGLAHPINEGGRPEILTQGSQQFLLPTGKPGAISPMDTGGSGGTGNIEVNIISNGTPQTVEGTSFGEGRVNIMIDDAIKRNNKTLNGQLATGRGDLSKSLQSGFTVQRNLNGR